MNDTNSHTMRSIFLEEMSELLQEIESDLLSLENTPGDRSLLDRLFRNLHTIKGGAGVAGMEPLSQFTHSVENMLDDVRRGGIALSPSVIALMLDARDTLKGFMAEALGEETLDHVRIEEIQTRIVGIMGKKGVGQTEPNAPLPVASVAPAPGPVDNVNTFMIQIHVQSPRFPSPDELKEKFNALGRLGKVTFVSHDHSLPPENKRQGDVFYLWRSVHLVTDAHEDRVMAALGDWPTRHRVTIELLDLLPEAPENQDSIDAAVDGTPPVLSVASLPSPSVTTERPFVPAPQPLKKNSKGDDQTAQKLSSIRVDTGKLDKLVNLVGELITIGARLDSFQASMEEKNTELAEQLLEILDDSSRTVSELQDQAMTIRMVPISGTFNPMQRLVHDYCRTSGKRVRLTIHGNDTEVDKKVAEQISGPLKHLIRNSLDHGIELPADREAAGKSVEGSLLLSAFHQYGLIVIEVADDGRGIDVAGVIRSAKKKGIIEEDRELSDREALELIFTPSLSTAKVVSEVSGRGVGMDVVKRDIEELRGTVAIDSVPGSGTKITMRIPMTLSIVDGLLVGVGDNRYIIPLSSVEECVELNADLTARDDSNFLDIRGELIPFLRIRELFQVPGDETPFEKVVIVSSGERRIGLVFDQLMGDHQTVIKPLSPLHRDVHCFLGATILGDGSVVLILDILHLIELGQSFEERLRTSWKP
ncbi:MAG: chemotaxis protein CheA [Magnetococcales bacterium]|nr:chemotaxis protein CheA [Magnetococcales bacterium]